MPECKRIGLREVRGLQPGQTLWEILTPGFGIRRQKGASVSYVLFYRTKEGRQRWLTIGQHGKLTPDQARELAKDALGDVAKGHDPAGSKQATRKAATVADLCDSYLNDAEAGRVLTNRKIPKKKSTLAVDKGRIERHIKPLLGHLKVAAVTSKDVEDFMNAVADGKTAARAKTNKKRGLAVVRGGMGTASRAVGFLGGLFSYAVRHRMRPDNPVRGVIRPADGKRDRRLSDAEYGFLGKTLAQAQESGIWPPAIEALRFLALTGWRRGEALNLRWEEIDLMRRTAFLADTKTGQSVRPLSKPACDILEAMKKIGDGRPSSFVFPSARKEKSMTGFTKLWKKIAHSSRNPLPPDITPHVFRHSFSSLAADLGYSELTIAAMIGHKGHSITSRYVHPADAVLLAAADTVANKTAELMGMKTASAKVIRLQKRG
jgi:integrase